MTPQRSSTLCPRDLLQEELSRRCAKNPRYSMRAFGRALGLSPTVLSLVLSGKRPLSRKAIGKVALALGLGPDEKAELLRNRDMTATERAPVLKIRQMSLDTFAVISEWYHYAILSLLETPRATLESRWISRRLLIPELQAKAAIERLIRLGLVAKVEGRWRQAGGAIRIDDETSTVATRKFQRQLLERAIESLENDPIETRDFSSMTFAMDPRLLARAAARIKKFRRALVEDLENQGTPEEVYNLTIQLYPVSHLIGKGERK